MSEVRKKRTITDYICEKIIAIVGQDKEISELDKKKLDYWVKMIYLSVTKIVIMLTVAILLNLLVETLILWLFFAMIKKTAFGMHAKTSLSCTITTVIIFDGGALLDKYVDFPDYILYLIYIITFIIFLFYAPADTEARPLVGKKNREKFKKRTIFTVSFLFVVVIAFGTNKIQTLLAISALAEAISIIPITYKIFKRRYGNYEYYKKDKR